MGGGRRRRQANSFVTSVAIGMLFAAAFTLLVSRGNGVPLWPAIVVWPLAFGLPIGASMYLLFGWILPRLRFQSFVLSVGASTLSVVMTVLLCFWIGLFINVNLETKLSPFEEIIWIETTRQFTSATSAWAMFATVLLTLLIGALKQISRKLGPGILWRWVSGTYHRPRLEDRIFLFLDLRDSTGLAEQLGNIQFSELIRDFFFDLSGPVLQTRGEVSHYIGDEAVLTWLPKRGLARSNCIRCFFLMREVIESRRAYYLERYGIVPAFKAGAHMGPVVATEVGDLKSEIVFHGDVLNTAARIQGLCNELSADLLVSRDLADRLETDPALLMRSMGLHELRGKGQPVEILRVEQALPLPVIPQEAEQRVPRT